METKRFETKIKKRKQKNKMFFKEKNVNKIMKIKRKKIAL